MTTDSKTSRSTFWQALALVGQLGFRIAVPLVVLALVGRFLDHRFHTSPWLFLAGIIVSIIISTISLLMKFSQLMREIDRVAPKK